MQIIALGVLLEGNHRGIKSQLQISLSRNHGPCAHLEFEPILSSFYVYNIPDFTYSCLTLDRDTSSCESTASKFMIQIKTVVGLAFLSFRKLRLLAEGGWAGGGRGRRVLCLSHVPHNIDKCMS